jgi:hypothetical protein
VCLTTLMALEALMQALPEPVVPAKAAGEVSAVTVPVKSNSVEPFLQLP